MLQQKKRDITNQFHRSTFSNTVYWNLEAPSSDFSTFWDTLCIALLVLYVIRFSFLKKMFQFDFQMFNELMNNLFAKYKAHHWSACNANQTFIKWQTYLQIDTCDLLLIIIMFILSTKKIYFSCRIIFINQNLFNSLLSYYIPSAFSQIHSKNIFNISFSQLYGIAEKFTSVGFPSVGISISIWAITNVEKLYWKFKWYELLIYCKIHKNIFIHNSVKSSTILWISDNWKIDIQ